MWCTYTFHVHYGVLIYIVVFEPIQQALVKYSINFQKYNSTHLLFFKKYIYIIKFGYFRNNNLEASAINI